jgi:glycyl-tRNA synthetase alpha chain
VSATFQDMILKLERFWADHGCVIAQPCDVEVGAGTLNSHTFLRVLGDKPWNVAYVEPCRRPADGRFGENPNRMQHFYQYQVILKPAPNNCQDLYLDSLRAIDIDPNKLDVRFIEDDWEHPALGSWGLGWEVWALGMEITQFTYFQQNGGVELTVPCCELTYGLERLAMYLQDVENVYDLVWAVLPSGKKITYGDVHKNDEIEWSHHNFHQANIEMCIRHFEDYYNQADELLQKNLVIPAYDYVLKCSHAFNILDARGSVSVTQRAQYIGRIRAMAKKCAQTYVEKYN